MSREYKKRRLFMNNENFEPLCKAGRCGHQIKGDSVGCTTGPGNCIPVSLLEAEESGFHDSNLIDATRSIKDILASIPQDANGRTLSFLNTRMGTLLAWVEHGQEAWDGAVTGEDDDATIADALKLKNVTSVGAAY
jgi:hypothetical protein